MEKTPNQRPLIGISDHHPKRSDQLSRISDQLDHESTTTNQPPVTTPQGLAPVSLGWVSLLFRVSWGSRLCFTSLGSLWVLPHTDTSLGPSPEVFGFGFSMFAAIPIKSLFVGDLQVFQS